jgi:peptide-methionine (S)-S-oxide reductase
MIKKAVLAGGCFWGLEDLIRRQSGVLSTRVGYAGGQVERPTYDHHSGHAEAVEISYDDEKIDYKHLLDFFFRVHNPTTLNQQGNDIGTSYRSVIFFADEAERQMASDFIELVNRSGRWPDPVVTSLELLTKFWPAEDYHQKYLQKNPGGYTCHFVRSGSYLS